MWNWLGITNEPKTTADVENKESQEPATEENKDGDQTNKENLEKETDQSQTLENQSAEKKVTEVAANLGNYLYNFANAATKTANKLKDTVDQKLEKTIVGDFNRENEKFVQERDTRRIGDAVPPWVGFHEEKVMKSQILALSSDERNFLRDPPSGVDFQFNLESMMPVAMAVLKDDKDLETMRFTLVPKRVKEDRFWRNYFYRVSLIKQSTQLSSMSNKDFRKSSESLNNCSDKSEPTTPKETTPRPSTTTHDDTQLEDVAGSPPGHEFISDAFDDNAHLSEEEKTQMLGLGDDSKATKEESEETANNDWDLDKELQDELESFELVNDTNGNEEEDDEWQKEIEDLLEEEEETTKP